MRRMLRLCRPINVNIPETVIRTKQSNNVISVTRIITTSRIRKSNRMLKTNRMPSLRSSVFSSPLISRSNSLLMSRFNNNGPSLR
jgi:hypothetical protein